nr:YihY/virulence factor BrkB family protein [Desulfobacterales bacterium]
DYLALMIICPFIFIVSSSVNFFITTTIKRLTEQQTLLDIFSPFIFFSLKLIPYILIWTLFTFIYIIMPNTRVKLSSGLLGGIVAGTAYQLIQGVYISFQVGVSGYNAIYGSFAALPMFLLWLQMSWLIVLAGTELSFSHQNIEKYALKQNDDDNISLTFKRLSALNIMHLLIHFFSQGKKALTEAEISKNLELPKNFVARILGELLDCRLVSCIRTDDDEIASFQPALDINKLSIYYILDAMDKHGTDFIPLKKDPSLEALSKSLKTMELAVKKSNANILLKDLQYNENQTNT